MNSDLRGEIMFNPMYLMPFRFGGWLIKHSFKPRDLGFYDTLEQTFHAMPSDIDFNMHMHNSRYAMYMDIGRLSFMFKCGVMGKALKKKWFPVLAGANFYYRRPINFFEKFTLKTRVLCWDEKWFYFVQTFLNSKGDIATVAYVRTTLLQKKKGLTTGDILEGMGLDIQSREMPEDLKNWIASSRSFVDRVKETEEREKAPQKSEAP